MKNAPSNKKTQKWIEKLHSKIKKGLKTFPRIDFNLIWLNLCEC